MSQVTTERPGRGGQVFRAAPRGDVTALPDLLRGRPRAGPDRDRRPIYVDLDSKDRAARERTGYVEAVQDANSRAYGVY